VCFVTTVRILRQFRRLTWPDRVLLIETLFFLAVAALITATLPFRYIGSFAARPVRGSKPPAQVQVTILDRIRWAVPRAARRVPWRAMCFEQGLAAQIMLRKRGIPSVLYFGATQEDGNLSAHVWVRVDDVDVVGGESASQHALLAQFPPRNAP
jgi:hypothetical protein